MVDKGIGTFEGAIKKTEAHLAHQLLLLLLVLCLQGPDPRLMLHNHCLQLPEYIKS